MHKTRSSYNEQCPTPAWRNTQTCWNHTPVSLRRKISREDRQQQIVDLAERAVGIAPLAKALFPDDEKPTGPDGKTLDLHDRNARAVSNPVEDLAHVAGVIRDAFDKVGERVNALTTIGKETLAGGEQLRAEIQLWQMLIGHLRAILVDMTRLNLDERLVRLEERRADIVADELYRMVAAVTAALELSPSQEKIVLGEVVVAVDRITDPDARNELIARDLPWARK